MKVRKLIGLLVVCGIGVSGIGIAAAQPAAPPAGYKIDPEFTETSPDGATSIEQYLNKDTDDWKWQFWVRRQGRLTLLDPEPAGYPAGFRFTNDLKWIVRMQKNRLGRVDALSVPPGSARLRSRDQEAAGRSGMGLFQESSRVAKGQEGPRVSHFRESLEGD